MRLEALALCGAVRLVVIIIESALADGDHPRVVCGLRERRRTEIGMRIRLVWVHPDAAPDIGLALRQGDDLIPFALPRRDVEKSRDATRPGVVEHFRLPLGQALVIQVAMAIDEPHAAASSAS